MNPTLGGGASWEMSSTRDDIQSWFCMLKPRKYLSKESVCAPGPNEMQW